MRQQFLDWQFSDYPAKHRDRANLLLHLFAVPLFHVASFLFAAGCFMLSLPVAGVGLGLGIVSLILQGRGHRREPERPSPFHGASDFLLRFLAEQWITFPRFVFSGGWQRNFDAASRRR
jgi:hypothetical protein